MLCGCDEGKRLVLVLVESLKNKVTLYDVNHREHDNADISYSVVHMMEVASKIHEIELNMEKLRAKVVNIKKITRDEDLLVAVCHIVECHTFGVKPKLD